jgi:hypothetical protein
MQFSHKASPSRRAIFYADATGSRFDVTAWGDVGQCKLDSGMPDAKELAAYLTLARVLKPITARQWKKYQSRTD